MWWWLYAFLAFGTAALLTSSAAVITYYVAGPAFQSQFLQTRTQSGAQFVKYACQSNGGCQLASDGSFTSMDECTDYCDHAQCIVVGTISECQHLPGTKNTPSMSECRSTCGQNAQLTHVCDPSTGCRLASFTETPKYSDSTCNNECVGWDLSSNGICELLPLEGGAAPKYEGLSACENANYSVYV